MRLAARLHVADPVLRAALASPPPGAGVEADVADLLAGSPPACADLVLVVVDGLHGADPADLTAAIMRLAADSLVLLAGTTATVLPDAARLAGVHPGGWSQPHEVRVQVDGRLEPRRVHDLLVHDRVLLADKVEDGVRVLATASMAYQRQPVLALHHESGLGVLALGTQQGTWTDPQVWRLLVNLAHVWRQGADETDVRVGMLGFGAIGLEHAAAVDAVPGLRLVAVSDLSPARLQVARQAAPGVRTSTDADALLSADDVDLVVVSTPPNTHAAWGRRLLAAGRHVVLEKPMALSAADCDDLMALAQQHDRLVVVYQNRRFDPDYLALARVVRSGRIGEVFHLESFVGGYGHPCSYWHSEASVSGGAIMDWGSHYLDQVLDLVPEPLRHVSAVNHKRRWFDVTNADHSRVTLHYADGREASFVHSDLAAAPKPKWYVLGTSGAVVGHWRTERVLGRSPVGTLEEDVLAPADSPATLTVHDADGSVTALAVPPSPPQAFHRELADHLQRGLPLSVRPEQSRRVVAVLEAAEHSARAGGAPVPVP